MIKLLAAWIQKLKQPLVFGAGVALFVAVYTFFMPNMYRSEVRLLPVEAKGSGGLGQLAAAAVGLGINLGGQDAGDASQLDVLKSRWLRQALLDTTYHFHERTWALGKVVEHNETLAQYFHSTSRDRALSAVGGLFSASKDMKSKMLSLTAETKSPELSQALVQRAAGLLQEFYKKNAQTRGGAKAAFARARLTEARSELVTVQGEFRQFLDKNRNFLNSQDASIRLQGMALEMEFKLRQQLVTSLALSLEQALMEEKNDMPILTVLDDGNLPVDKSSPRRTIFVLFAFGLVFAAVLAWENRSLIVAKLQN